MPMRARMTKVSQQLPTLGFCWHAHVCMVSQQAMHIQRARHREDGRRLLVGRGKRPCLKGVRPRCVLVMQVAVLERCARTLRACDASGRA